MTAPLARPDVERLLDNLVAAREWMDTVIHGGAVFKHGMTLVDGERLLERLDATLMQAPALPDAAAVARAAEAIRAWWPLPGTDPDVGVVTRVMARAALLAAREPNLPTRAE